MDRDMISRVSKPQQALENTTHCIWEHHIGTGDIYVTR